MEISNRFESLSQISDDNNPENNIETSSKTSPFIRGPQCLTTNATIKEIVSGNYVIKVLNNKQVKIQSKTSESYSYCERTSNTEFHTYKLKQEKSYKVRIYTPLPI